MNYLEDEEQLDALEPDDEEARRADEIARRTVAQAVGARQEFSGDDDTGSPWRPRITPSSGPPARPQKELPPSPDISIPSEAPSLPWLSRLVPPSKSPARPPAILPNAPDIGEQPKGADISWLSRVVPKSSPAPYEPDRSTSQFEHEGAGLANEPMTPGAERAAKAAVLSRLMAERPEAPQPKWWQRLAAGAVGGLAGYVNASGKHMNPIDASGATDAIMGGPGYRNQLEQWKARVAGAQNEAESAAAGEAAWFRNRTLTADEARKKAQDQRDADMAAASKERNANALARQQADDARKKDEDFIGKNPDAMWLDKDEVANLPEGWRTMPSASQPGRILAKPPSFMVLPEELAEYATGHKAGDKIPYSLFKAAQERAGRDTLAQNKPATEREVSKAEQVVLNRTRYTPQQVADAERILADRKRQPVSATAAPLSDSDPSAVAIADYRMAPISPRSAATPQGKALMDQVYKLNPSYDAKRFASRNRMLQAYTVNGRQSREINAINTVMGHVSVLGESIDALENGNLQVLNRIANRLGVEVGNSPATTLQAIVNRVGPELVTAYVGTGGEAGERKMNKEDFDVRMSPKQLLDNVKITVRLLRSKMGSLEHQWKNEMGLDDFEERFLTDEAKESLAKWSPSKQPSRSPAGKPQQQAPSPSPGQSPKVGPRVGTVIDGMKFKGGDPNDQNNWEAVARR